MKEMASQLKKGRNELSEVDICDGSLCSEEESGVFVNAEEFTGFQGWTPEFPGDTLPSPGERVSDTAAGGNSAGADALTPPKSSIVDRLLVELYETCSRRTADGWDSSTEASGSDAFLGRSNSGSGFLQELQEKQTRRHQMSYLSQKDREELCSIIREVKYRTSLQSAKLIRHLRRRDRLHHKLQKNYDVVTACLQAVSQKRRVDTRLKFTIEPLLGQNGFQQWYDALKAVARLPTGIPKEWRKRVWLTLADQYLHSISIDWEKTLRFAFNERSNPDDDSLGIQIVKDLHRTGCSSYCGQEAEQDRVVLKRVLLAFARWNKTVGYCQGFNVLAALILEVTEGSESDALKVMIYLIDKVLPDSYFANNLRALSVDMAVFRDLLRLKLPRLSQHLHHLQRAANREAGGSYEPPLTNVFTMQWFLTMFATCLPAHTVLRIWDSVFFEGSEVLFRVALAIWERLGERVEFCQTADEFYSTMGQLTQEMLEQSLVQASELMQEVYSMAAFPFPQLAELREKYTYNITPFPTAVKSNGSGGLGSWESDDDVDMDDEDSVVTALGCLGPLGGLLAPELQRYHKHLKDQRAEQGSIAELSPGAVGAGTGGSGARAETQSSVNSMMMERMSTDINALKKQYTRTKRRQQQQAMQLCIYTDKCPATRVLASQLNPSGSVVNHLLLGRRPLPGPRSCRLTSASLSALPGSGPGSPSRRRCSSLLSNSSGSPGGSGGGVPSPWRLHMRQHRRNISRARAQLGFEDEEQEGGRGEEEDKGCTPPLPDDDDDDDAAAAPSQEEEREGEQVHLEEVEVKLESLDLREDEEEEEEWAASVSLESEFHAPPPFTPPKKVQKSESSPERSSSPPECPASLPPSSLDLSPDRPAPSPPPLASTPSPDRLTRLPCSSSLGGLSSLYPACSSSSTSSLVKSPSLCSVSSSKSNLSSSGAPRHFSPFPSVKQPRRSQAARNLGLYGPTSRTPAVLFPQLSRGPGTAARR